MNPQHTEKHISAPSTSAKVKGHFWPKKIIHTANFVGALELFAEAISGKQWSNVHQLVFSWEEGKSSNCFSFFFAQNPFQLPIEICETRAHAEFYCLVPWICAISQACWSCARSHSNSIAGLTHTQVEIDFRSNSLPISVLLIATAGKRVECAREWKRSYQYSRVCDKPKVV